MPALIATVRWNDLDARKCKAGQEFCHTGDCMTPLCDLLQISPWLLQKLQDGIAGKAICLYYFFFSHSKNVDASRKDLFSPSPFVVLMPPPCYNDHSHVC